MDEALDVAIPRKNRPSPRPQQAEVLRFCKLILTAGDEVFDIPEYVLSLCKSPLRELFFKYETETAEMLLKCAEAMPCKIGIYVATIGVLSSEPNAAGGAENKSAENNSAEKNDLRKRTKTDIELESFKKTLLDEFAKQLQKCLQNSNRTAIIMYLRILAGFLSIKLIKPESFFGLLDALLNCPPKTEDGGSSLEMDSAIFIVLSALPWLTCKAFANHKKNVTKYIDFAVSYAKRRECPWKPAVSILKGANYPDRLDTLIEAAQTLLEKNWQAAAIFRFYQTPILAAVIDIPHPSPLPFIAVEPSAVVGAPIEAVLRLPLTRTRADDILLLHDHWLLEDHVLRIIQNFCESPVGCAKTLLRLPIPNKQFDYILVETILSEICRVSTCAEKKQIFDFPIFHAVLLKHLTQAQPSFLDTIQQAVQSIVKRLFDMDSESYDNLVDFFGYWLSVNECEWKFEDWLVSYHPPPALQRFIADSFAALTALSYRPNIMHNLPECAHDYMGEEVTFECDWLSAGERPTILPETGPPLEFYYLRDDLLVFSFRKDRLEEQSEAAKGIIQMLCNPPLLSYPSQFQTTSIKPQSEDTAIKEPQAEELTEEMDYGEGEEMSNFDSGKPVRDHSEVVEIFLRTLLVKGSRSNTHMAALLDNFSFLFILLRPRFLYGGGWLEGREANEKTVSLRCCPVGGGLEEDVNLGEDINTADNNSIDKNLNSGKNTINSQKTEQDDRTYYLLVVQLVIEFTQRSHQTMSLILSKLGLLGLVPIDLIIENASQLPEYMQRHKWLIINSALQITAHLKLPTTPILIKTEEGLDAIPTEDNYAKTMLTRVVGRMLELMLLKWEEGDGGEKREWGARLLAYGRKYAELIGADLLNKLEKYPPLAEIANIFRITRTYFRPITRFPQVKAEHLAKLLPNARN